MRALGQGGAKSAVRQLKTLHAYSTQSMGSLTVCVCAHLQLYKLQSALRQAGVTMYGGERASHTLSIERAKSDRQVVRASSVSLCFLLCVLGSSALSEQDCVTCVTCQSSVIARQCDADLQCAKVLFAVSLSVLKD